MTDPSPDPKRVPEPFITIPVSLLRRVRQLKLSGTQYDLWLYLYELDPYGNQWVEVPPPDEIAVLLKVDPRTVQRCAQRLVDCDLFEMQIKRWKARNTNVLARFRENSTGKEIHLRTKRSKDPELDQSIQKLDQNVGNWISLPEEKNGHCSESADGNGFENGVCTNNRSIRIKEQQNTPTHHPVSVGNEPGKDLVQALETTEAQIYQSISEAQIGLNKTIRTHVAQLIQQAGSRVALQVVDNALSAVQEQRSQGNCRNPGGMLVAAIRGNYTANGAKRQARKHREATPPDWVAVGLAIDQALINGDRTFALAKLQQLWAEGWHQEIKELCRMHRNWHYRVTGSGIEEVNP